MQQQPLFIAQICHNSRIIEKVHFGRSAQDAAFPINVILQLLHLTYFSNLNFQ